MPVTSKPMKSSFIKWVTAGSLGGWACAFLVFSIAGLIGRSGDSGTEHFGYWSPAYIILAMFYGIPIGAICLALCRFMLFRTSDAVLFDNSCKLILVTVLGGVVGCFQGFFTAAAIAIICFVSTLIWFSTR